jgi:hypothetical protein
LGRKAISSRIRATIGALAIWFGCQRRSSGFTDGVSKIKRMMRKCAFHMYDQVCEDPDAAVEAELIKKGVVPDE